MNTALEEWLQLLNRELAEQGVPHRRRPFEAIARYSDEHHASIDLSSSLSQTIFNWFRDHSPPGAHHLGSIYESVYFYDTAFWLVSIPLVYGTASLNALDSLEKMPAPVRAALEEDEPKCWDYVVYWADCVDYGLGMDDFRTIAVGSEFARGLVFAGDAELRSAVELLHQSRPQAQALLVCRMAAELFLKAFAALRGRLDEATAKEMGHNLEKAFDLFLDVSGLTHWRPLRSRLAVFPPVSARYKPRAAQSEQLWTAFSLVQSLGTVVLREVTGRNTMTQVLPGGPPALSSE